jgi:hypothetical protein
MAKRKHGAKSAAIREYLEANPNAKPKEVVEALKAKRMSVSAQMVSVLRGKQKRNPGRGRPKAGANGPAGIESLLEAKKLVSSLGGVEEARQALSTLAKLLAG